MPRKGGRECIKRPAYPPPFYRSDHLPMHDIWTPMWGYPLGA
ncbi:hypothetical protein JCM7447_14020 [Corynebacterium amycolatum]